MQLQLGNCRSLSNECTNQLLRELYLSGDESEFGPLLSAFQVPGSSDSETSKKQVFQPPNRNQLPVEVLSLLTPILTRSLHTPSVINALVSGRLIQLYCAIGGKSVS